MRERQNLELSINNLIKYSQSLEDYCSLLQLAEEEQDFETAQDAEAAIYDLKKEIDKEINKDKKIIISGVQF